MLGYIILYYIILGDAAPLVAAAAARLSAALELLDLQGESRT